MISQMCLESTAVTSEGATGCVFPNQLKLSKKYLRVGLEEANRTWPKVVKKRSSATCDFESCVCLQVSLFISIYIYIFVWSLYFFLALRHTLTFNHDPQSCVWEDAFAEFRFVGDLATCFQLRFWARNCFYVLWALRVRGLCFTGQHTIQTWHGHLGIHNVWS